MDRLTPLQWLRYGPFLAQVVVVRRCNLSCGYCNEFDRTSEPVPVDRLVPRLEKLRDLRAWAVCLTGGEPTLHPELPRLVGVMRDLGIRRRMMITNGFRLRRGLIEALNDAGLTDLQISVDGVHPNEVTQKVLKPLRPKLELLARYARFRVVMSGVIGSAPPEEALEVVDFARRSGFSPRILLLHEGDGNLALTPAERAAYREVKRRIGRAAREAGDYRERLIATGEAPFKCRAGARYLYVDEHGRVSWCSQTRSGFGRDLLQYTYDDLRAQFHAPKACNVRCTVGCVRTASAWDEWRPIGAASAGAAARAAVVRAPPTTAPSPPRTPPP
jgi:MoaA/NifB/PqqE/SkfB family radical SAM enzyme